MKFLHTAFQNMKAPFEKGGKFEKYNKVLTAIDALETFAFTPEEVTHTGAHIRDGIDLKRTMSVVIMAMIPCLLFGMYNAGYQHYRELGELATASFMDMFTIGLIKVLPLVVVSYGVGLGIEFAFAMFKGHSVEEGYLVTGMLIPLIVPIDIPLWMLAVAVAFAVVFGKEVFGGTGMNILNVALTARAFLFFAYPTFMSGDKIWIHEGMTNDAISGATILGDLAAMKGGLETLRFSAQDMFLGFIPGSVGETSTLAVLIGAAILLFTGIGSWRIMLAAVLGGATMGAIFNFFGDMGIGGGLMQLPFWQHLIVGGFAFGVVFMATDPVTAAQTNKGKWIYGFLIGLLAIMIRVFNPAYPEGIMLAILFMNVMAPLVDHYVVQGNINKRLKRLNVKTA
ncbi:MAG: NADH:ubiquinone reductase (Na(+)-transporting) subunit B [Flavobacteriales bacterium]|nr:NADH:ubiquinone reductase (Na(+)-transporting) subunit B [Flavobacteriales bacterium]